MSFAASSSTARRLSRCVDVVYVHASQMTAGFAPWLRRLSGDRPYVLRVQDLWPDSITGSSMMSGGLKERLISGDVLVGQRTMLGANSTVLQGLTVGADATVGAAACWTKDVAAKDAAGGVPAHTLTLTDSVNRVATR